MLNHPPLHVRLPLWCTQNRSSLSCHPSPALLSQNTHTHTHIEEARTDTHRHRKAGRPTGTHACMQHACMHAVRRRYSHGWNPAALIAVALGALPTLPGLLATVGAVQGVPPLLMSLYSAAWFVGVGISTVVYCGLMALGRGGSGELAGSGGGAPAPAGSA